MKNNFTMFALALLTAFTFVACAEKSVGPGPSAEQFIKALYNNDFDAAKNMVTDDTRGNIEVLQNVHEMIDDGKAGPKVTEEDITIGEIKIDGAMAKVPFTAKKGEKTEKGSLTLRKQEDGTWLVEYKDA